MEKNSETEREEDFSIILGTRRPSDSPPKKEKPKKAEKKPPEPEVVQEKPPKKESLGDLLKKKDELELFLSSMDEAHLHSRMPEYAYEGLKKKSEFELKKIEGKIKKMGYKDVKKDGDELEKNLNEIKEAIDMLKDTRIIDTEYNQQEHPDNSKLRELEKRIEGLGKMLRDVTEMLKKRIDEVAVTGDVEITESVREMKREIDAIRYSLSEFVRKAELEDIMLRPAIKIPGKYRAGVPQEVPKSGGKSVSIKKFPRFVGRDVTADCRISLFNSMERGKQKIYWYRIEDSSGSSILMSYSQIKVRKRKVTGEVKKTKHGLCYLLFKGLA
jgi:hypothetical protein